jgi:uncharacterized protein YqjF (DUF2071 family)
VNAPWLIAMDWQDALFVHWPFPVDAVRPLVPASLTLDTWEGQAWISAVAFRIAGLRPRGFPRSLSWPSFAEINLRTYVVGDRPGVWFFSLDAASWVAVRLARAGLHLPYNHADVLAQHDGTRLMYFGAREGLANEASEIRYAVEATCEGAWAPAPPASRERWLTERYAFYTADREGQVRRGDVIHEPWQLQTATVRAGTNLLFEAVGLPRPATAPIAYASPGVSTQASAPRLLPEAVTRGGPTDRGR